MAMTKMLVIGAFVGAIAFASPHALADEVGEAFDLLASDIAEAGSEEERTGVLRGFTDLVERFPESDEARLMAFAAGNIALRQNGPNQLLDGLADYIENGDLLDPNAIVAVVEPALNALGDMADLGILKPEDAAAFDQALKDLDQALATAGARYSLETLLSDPFAESPALASALGRLRQLDSLARFFNDARRYPDLTGAERRRMLDSLRSPFTRYIGPGLAGPGWPMLRDGLVWNSELADANAEGVRIVEDAIRNGRVDEERLRRLDARLRFLARGPWNRDTLRDMLASVCSLVPGTGSLCQSIFDHILDGAEAIGNVTCGEITCDCGYLDGIAGALRGVECALREAQMQAQCFSDGAPQSACLAGASGPNATSWEPQPR